MWAHSREIFPALLHSKISHSWMGFVAYTFDQLPHVGAIDGLLAGYLIVALIRPEKF